MSRFVLLSCFVLSLLALPARAATVFADDFSEPVALNWQMVPGQAAASSITVPPGLIGGAAVLRGAGSALISRPIMLQMGATYQLSFDYALTGPANDTASLGFWFAGEGGTVNLSAGQGGRQVFTVQSFESGSRLSFSPLLIGSGAAITLDNVVIASVDAVPLPPGLATLAAGLGFLGWSARRRRT